MKRELLLVPDKRLREKANPADDPSSPYVKELAAYMLGHLDGVSRIGLAAPQLGESVRLFVAKLQGIELIFVNPETTKKVGLHTIIEGCSSIPGRFFWVKRPKVVKVTGFNLDGQRISVKGHDLLAQLICHEVDHLNGVLIDEIGTEWREYGDR